KRPISILGWNTAQMPQAASQVFLNRQKMPLRRGVVACQCRLRHRAFSEPRKGGSQIILRQKKSCKILKTLL
ncbi:hypothetical protein, partial [Treponema sp.]|uniref:hypothetical protein n=1 Tax=Treponema sp. TaxID=166 RepID=UPI0025E92754